MTTWPTRLEMAQIFYTKMVEKKSSLVYRNRKLLDAVRASPCQHCGVSDGTVVAAHSNQLRDGKGRGLKAHDYRIAALCFKCHHDLDQGSKMSRQERLNMWEDAHRATVGWLFESDIIGVK
jgi:hypothetical protein